MCRQLRRRVFLFILIAAFATLRADGSEIVVNHLPKRSGGPFSDSSFINAFGHLSSQNLADDFTVGAETFIHRVPAWGFYNDDNAPAVERMRVRFYDDVAGLPGSVVFEQEFSDSQRTPTGQIVFVGIAPREYAYTFELAAPINVLAGTRYWLELIQIGDPGTAWRWETSSSANRNHVFINPFVSDWTFSNGSDLAFQLIAIPEPLTANFFALVLISARLRGRFGWRRAGKWIGTEWRFMHAHSVRSENRESCGA